MAVIGSADHGAKLFKNTVENWSRLVSTPPSSPPTMRFERQMSEVALKADIRLVKLCGRFSPIGDIRRFAPYVWEAHKSGHVTERRIVTALTVLFTRHARDTGLGTNHIGFRSVSRVLKKDSAPGCQKPISIKAAQRLVGALA